MRLSITLRSLSCDTLRDDRGMPLMTFAREGAIEFAWSDTVAQCDSIWCVKVNHPGWTISPVSHSRMHKSSEVIEKRCAALSYVADERSLAAGRSILGIHPFSYITCMFGHGMPSVRLTMMIDNGRRLRWPAQSMTSGFCSRSHTL